MKGHCLGLKSDPALIEKIQTAPRAQRTSGPKSTKAEFPSPSLGYCILSHKRHNYPEHDVSHQTGHD